MRDRYLLMCNRISSLQREMALSIWAPNPILELPYPTYTLPLLPLHKPPVFLQFINKDGLRGWGIVDNNNNNKTQINRGAAPRQPWRLQMTARSNPSCCEGYTHLCEWKIGRQFVSSIWAPNSNFLDFLVPLTFNVFYPFLFLPASCFPVVPHQGGWGQEMEHCDEYVCR